MTDYTPMPTQFDGCCFRSKSEAMFAAALSSPRGWSCRDWIYELAFLQHQAWVPDFAIPKVDETHKLLSLIVVEYKPSRVTETYRQTFERHVRAISTFSIPLDCWLVCYDWFGDSANMAWHFWRGGLVEAGHVDQEAGAMAGGIPWLNGHVIAEVKAMRFDLQNCWRH